MMSILIGVEELALSTLEIYQFPLYFIMCRKTISASHAIHESYLWHKEDKNVWRCPRDETQTSLLTLLSDINDTMSFLKLRESCTIKRFLWRVYGIDNEKNIDNFQQVFSNTIKRINDNNMAVKVIFFRKMWTLIKIIRFFRFFRKKIKK